MAQQETPMYMDDWISRLDSLIQLNGKDLLTHAGRISQDLSKEKATLEYKRFKQLSQEKECDKNLSELAADIEDLKKTK